VCLSDGAHACILARKIRKNAKRKRNNPAILRAERKHRIKTFREKSPKIRDKINTVKVMCRLHMAFFFCPKTGGKIAPKNGAVILHMESPKNDRGQKQP
jgi:hypothetical protein